MAHSRNTSTSEEDHHEFKASRNYLAETLFQSCLKKQTNKSAKRRDSAILCSWTLLLAITKFYTFTWNLLPWLFEILMSTFKKMVALRQEMRAQQSGWQASVTCPSQRFGAQAQKGSQALCLAPVRECVFNSSGTRSSRVFYRMAPLQHQNGGHKLRQP